MSVISIWGLILYSSLACSIVSCSDFVMAGSSGIKRKGLSISDNLNVLKKYNEEVWREKNYFFQPNYVFITRLIMFDS